MEQLTMLLAVVAMLLAFAAWYRAERRRR